MTQENKINIAELLKDCPKGMELYSPLFGDCKFVKVHDYEAQIIVELETGATVSFTTDGRYYDYPNAECILFPKGKTTWEGFQRPFKDGDMLFVKSVYSWVLVYKESKNNEDLYKYVAIQDNHNHTYIVYDNNPLCCKEDVSEIRLATEEEKQKLFDAIKSHGYKWNEETKTLEKLPRFKVGDIIQDIDSYKVKIIEANIEDGCYEYESTFAKGIGVIPFSEQDNWELVPDVKPKFKAGDMIQHKENSGWVCTIRRVEDRYYVDGHPTFYTILFDNQDDYELVPNKFDINTLIPFESRVLVRNSYSGFWMPTFWGVYETEKVNEHHYHNYLTTKGFFRHCIPYNDDTKHLLGTTNDCDEFYKTWE